MAIAVGALFESEVDSRPALFRPTEGVTQSTTRLMSSGPARRVIAA